MAWSDVVSQGGGRKGEINNFRPISGNTYVVRFVGDPKPFHKYFVGGKSAICGDPKTCPVKAKYNIDPGLRYAVNLIDRKDGVLKVAELAPSVITPVINWWEATGKKLDPGGDNGVDFSIKVTGQKKMTRYAVTALSPSPFTAEEKKMIAEQAYNLDKLYKPCPENEIEARLFGQGGSPATVSVGQDSSGAPVSEEDIPF